VRLVALGVEFIHLLKRQTFSLVDPDHRVSITSSQDDREHDLHSPNEEAADEAERTPDEEDLGAEVGVTSTWVDHVRRGVCDGPVE